MTYRALLITVAMLIALSGVARTQTPDGTRIAAAKQMMDLAGSAAQFDQVMPLMSQQMSQAFKNIAPGNATEIDDVFRQLVPRFVARKGELLDQIAALYATEMTLDELNAIVAFYKSPAGVKFAAVQPKILRDSMTLGQRWGQKIGAEFADEARRELKKRGIDL